MSFFFGTADSFAGAACRPLRFSTATQVPRAWSTRRESAAHRNRPEAGRALHL